MGDQFDFSLLIGSQYEGGPMEWDEQNIYVANGTILNNIDLNKDSCKSLRLAKSDIISFSISPCRKFIAIVDEKENLIISSVASGKVLCSSCIKSKAADAPLVASWLPCSTKIVISRGTICQLFYIPMKEPSYNPIKLLRTYRGTYGDVQNISYSQESEIMALGSKDSKVRVYPIPNVKNMPRINTLIGCKAPIMGCWVGGDTGLDVVAVDQIGMVCMWQQDFQRNELEFDLNTKPQFFSPSILRREREKAKRELEVMEIESGDENEGDCVGESEDQNSVGENESDSESDQSDSSDEEVEIRYTRTFKDFVNQKGQKASGIVAADFHAKNRILACAHENGSFCLFEISFAPDRAERGSITEVQRLSMEYLGLNRIKISPKGDWLALGGTGSIVIWEWPSQSYVLEQQCQGHSVHCVSYSPCGTKIATGATDGAVKVWSTTSGFCIVTFKNHSSCVTGITWLRSGFALASCSKDSTVRVYDLRRYRNFRTLTTPTPQRLSDVTTDPGGEMIAAAGGDSGNVFIWSVRTGRLLDEFSNHESACAKVAFSPVSSRLLSCSWDGSAVITDFTDIEKIEREALECSTDMLSAVWRPDGNQIASSNLDGKLLFWSPVDMKVEFEIDCSRDIRQGRSKNQMVSAETLNDQGWKHITYSTDGDFLLAAGDSYLVVMYSLKARHVVGQYFVTSNLSLDGISEFLDKKSTMTEFGPLAEISKEEELKIAGQKKTDRSLRKFDSAIKCMDLSFSPAGNEFCIATPEGVSIFTKDSNTFAPVSLSQSATPENIVNSLESGNHSDALIMAFTLNEHNIMRRVIETIPLKNVDLIVATLPQAYAISALNFTASELETTFHAELYLTWCTNLLALISRNAFLKKKAKGAARLAARSVRSHRDKILNPCYSNMALVDFMKIQRDMKVKEKELGETDSLTNDEPNDTAEAMET